jgi:hypothetical protein
LKFSKTIFKHFCSWYILYVLKIAKNYAFLARTELAPTILYRMLSMRRALFSAQLACGNFYVVFESCAVGPAEHAEFFF